MCIHHTHPLCLSLSLSLSHTHTHTHARTHTHTHTHRSGDPDLEPDSVSSLLTQSSSHPSRPPLLAAAVPTTAPPTSAHGHAAKPSPATERPDNPFRSNSNSPSPSSPFFFFFFLFFFLFFCCCQATNVSATLLDLFCCRGCCRTDHLGCWTAVQGLWKGAWFNVEC